MRKLMFPQSTAVRIILLSITLLLPFNIVTSILMGVTIKNVEEQMDEEIQASLDLSAANLGELLQNVSVREIYMCVNADRPEFQEVSGTLEEYSSIEKEDKLKKVQDSVKDIWSEHTIADLIWYYFPQNGYMITQGVPGIDRNIYSKFIMETEEADRGSGMQWSAIEPDDVMMLYGYITWGDIKCGLMLNLNRTCAENRVR